MEADDMIIRIPTNPGDELGIQAAVVAAQARGLSRAYATLDEALIEMAPVQERGRLRAHILETKPAAATAVIVHALVPPDATLQLRVGDLHASHGTLPDGRDCVCVGGVMDPADLATVEQNRRRRRDR